MLRLHFWRKLTVQPPQKCKRSLLLLCQLGGDKFSLLQHECFTQTNVVVKTGSYYDACLHTVRRLLCRLCMCNESLGLREISHHVDKLYFDTPSAML